MKRPGKIEAKTGAKQDSENCRQNNYKGDNFRSTIRFLVENGFPTHKIRDEFVKRVS